MSDETTSIQAALADVLREIGAIEKTQQNKQQGFRYRGIDDVMNALHPSLGKHGVIILPQVIDSTRSDRQSKGGGVLFCVTLRVRYLFVGPDGSTLEAVVESEAFDSGDKATNKALSIAYKYAILQVLCIPTEELIDPDRDSHEVAATTQTASQPKQPKQPAQTRSADPPESLAEVEAALAALGYTQDDAELWKLTGWDQFDIHTANQAKLGAFAKKLHDVADSQ